MNNDISAHSMSRGSRRMLRFGWIALVVVLQAACAGVGPRPAVPISEVVAASKTGTPEQVIGRMGRTIYAPRGSDFGKLADLGVQPPVLDFIQVRFVNDVELLTRNFVQGNSRGGCSDCFPQPLELSNLATGGDGMSPDRPNGRLTGGGRPPGVPTWVPATTGTAMRNAPGLTVDEIARRAKAGEPVEQLVAEINRSRLDGLISQGLLSSGQINFGTRSSVGLSGSRLATLHHQGVPAPVLDAIQAQYLSQFIEIQRQRFNARRPP